MKLSSKIYAVVISVCVIVTVSATYAIIRANQFKVKNTKYVTTCIVRDKEDTWEVRVAFPEKKRILYKNGKKKKVIQELPTSEPITYMKLPSVGNNEYINVEESQPLSVLTWKSTKETSAKYLKYLEKEGYTEKRYIANKDSIEVYMEKEGKIKRIVIFESSIMASNIKNNTLGSLEIYFNN